MFPTPTEAPALPKQRACTESLRQVSEMQQGMVSTTLDAAMRATDIMADSAQVMFGNLRDLTVFHDDATDYSRAYGDFYQRQMELASHTAQALMDVSRSAGAEVSQTTADTGEEVARDTPEVASSAIDRAQSTVASTATEMTTVASIPITPRETGFGRPAGSGGTSSFQKDATNKG